MNAKRLPFHRLRSNGRPESPPVIALSAVMLAGNHFDSGDVVPPDIVAKVPEKNRLALIATGVLTTDPQDDISEAVLKLHEERRTTLEEADAAREVLKQIESDKATAEQEVEELERVHQASALSDYKAGKRSSNPQLDAERDRVAHLTYAKAQAVEEIERLDALVETLARRSELERAREVKDKHCGEVCVEIQKNVEALVPLFAQYRLLAAQFKRLTRDQGQQSTSTWRLDNLLAERLLGRSLTRDLRIVDLAEIEDRVFSGVLDRALKELKNGG